MFNRMFLSVLILNVFSVSFAAQPDKDFSNKSVRELYDELRNVTKYIDLEDIKKQVGIYCSLIYSNQIADTLKSAQRTGLNKQYQYLLLHDFDPQGSQKQIYIPRFFFDFKNLRIIACLQNMHGSKEPFTYSHDSLAKESDKIAPGPGQSNPFYAVL